MLEYIWNEGKSQLPQMDTYLIGSEISWIYTYLHHELIYKKNAMSKSGVVNFFIHLYLVLFVLKETCKFYFSFCLLVKAKLLVKITRLDSALQSVKAVKKWKVFMTQNDFAYAFALV